MAFLLDPSARVEGLLESHSLFVCLFCFRMET